MEETWRWFGPLDDIRLDEIRQTGATGVVTALHEIPYGEVWPEEAIRERVTIPRRVRIVCRSGRLMPAPGNGAGSCDR